MNSPNRKKWMVWALCAILVASGAVCVTASLCSFSTMRAYVDQFSGDGSADPYTPELHSRLQALTGMLGALTIALSFSLAIFTHWMPGSSWASRLGNSTRHQKESFQLNWFELRQLAIQSINSSWPLLLFASLSYVAIHLSLPQLPIRFDEAISWRDYSAKPAWITIAKYDTPNNHIFYNLITGRLISLFGDQLLVLRLTTFLCGFLVANLATAIAAQIFGRTAAIGTSICLIFSPAFLEYSIYARGYSLLTLLWLTSTTMLWIGISKNNILSLLFAGCVAAIGFWTVPVMLYPFAVTFCLMTAIIQKKRSNDQHTSRRYRFLQLIVWFMLTTVLTLLLYSPVLIVSGYESITANSYVRSLSMSEWTNSLPNWLCECGEVFYRPQSKLHQFCIVILTALAFIGLAFNRPYRELFSLLAAGSLVLVLMIGLQRLLPPPRTWIWITVPWSILMGAGWNTLASCLARIFSTEPNHAQASHNALNTHPESLFQTTDVRNKQANGESLTPWASLAMVIVFTMLHCGGWIVGVASNSLFASSNEGGRCDDASTAAAYLLENLSENEPVIAVCPASGTIDYYSKQNGLKSTHFDPPGMNGKEFRSAVVAVVNNRMFSQTVESVLATVPDTNLLRSWKSTIIFQTGEITLYRVQPE